MNRFAFLLIGLLAGLPALSADKYLELRANANAYEDPDRHSDVLAQLKLKSSPVILKWVSGKKENGYYLVDLTCSPGIVRC